MSELEHHPDAAIAPESVLEETIEPGYEHEHEGDGIEPEHERAPKKAPRFPFANRSKAGVAKWKRETRFGLAALLSFVILVSVLLVNKNAKKGSKPPSMAIASAKASGTSKSKPQADPDADQGKPETEKKQEKGEAKVEQEDQASKKEELTPPDPMASDPELPLAATSTPPLSDTSVRDAATESIRPPDPAPGVVPSSSPPDASKAHEGLDAGGLKGTESGLPLPATTAALPAQDEPVNNMPAPPEPAPLPTAGSSLGAGSESEPQKPAPPAQGTDLAAPVDAPMPGASAPAQAATPSADTPDATAPAQPVDPPAPAPDAGAPAQPVDPPAPSPDASAPAQPANPPALSPEASPTVQPAAPPALSPDASATSQPQTSMPLAPSPDPGPGLPLPGAGPSVGTGHATGAVEPAPPAVRPAEEVPNFAQPPSSDDAMAVSTAPPEFKPGEGIPIPNAGKVRSLDDDLTAKLAPAAVGASMAAAGAGTSAAKARVEAEADEDRQDQLTPELHVVQRGENFWTISRYYYNSGRYYMALWKANSRTVSAADQLMVGQTIVIPPPEALDRSLIQPPRKASSSPPRASSPIRKTSRSKLKEDDTAVQPSSEEELILPIDNSLLTRRSRSQAVEEVDPPPAKRYQAFRPRYKVRAHDTLRSIARDLLNDAHRADEIYDLNRDLFDDNPRPKLVEGQILELPEDARVSRASRSLD